VVVRLSLAFFLSFFLSPSNDSSREAVVRRDGIGVRAPVAVDAPVMSAGEAPAPGLDYERDVVRRVVHHVAPAVHDRGPHQRGVLAVRQQCPARACRLRRYVKGKHDAGGNATREPGVHSDNLASVRPADHPRGLV